MNIKTRPISECSEQVKNEVDINADYVVFSDNFPVLELSKVGAEYYVREFGKIPVVWGRSGLNKISRVVRKYHNLITGVENESIEEVKK